MLSLTKLGARPVPAEAPLTQPLLCEYSVAGLRRVALLERRLRIEVVTRRLDEGSDGLVLRRGGDLRKHVAVLVELPLEGRRDVDERLRGHLLRTANNVKHSHYPVP